jgi:hypothetical protein
VTVDQLYVFYKMKVGALAVDFFVFRNVESLQTLSLQSG